MEAAAVADTPAEPPRSTELERREPARGLTTPASREVLMPLDPTQVVEGMKAYQKLMHDLLDPTDWQVTPETEPDPQNPGQTRKKRFPKKSAYRKIGRAFNLTVERIHHAVHFSPDGTPQYAEATYRATAPNGQFQDGDGYCGLAEFKGKRAQDPKLLNAMAGTATTRAKNRAISDLVGMGEVSAEEVSRGGDTDATSDNGGGGEFAEAASVEQRSQAVRALAYLLDVGDGPNAELAEEAVRAVEADCGNFLPRKMGRAFGLVAARLKATVDARDAELEHAREAQDAAAEEPPAPAPGQTYGEPPPEQAQRAQQALDDLAGDPPASVSGEVLPPEGDPPPLPASDDDIPF